jgi:hypothetical protein
VVARRAPHSFDPSEPSEGSRARGFAGRRRRGVVGSAGRRNHMAMSRGAHRVVGERQGGFDGSVAGRQAAPWTERPPGTLLMCIGVSRAAYVAAERGPNNPVAVLVSDTRAELQLRPILRGFIAPKEQKRALPGYRSHSSFVDGRDARLVVCRLPSVDDQRRKRPPSLRKRWAEPRAVQQGRMRESPRSKVEVPWGSSRPD